MNPTNPPPKAREPLLLGCLRHLTEFQERPVDPLDLLTSLSSLSQELEVCMGQLLRHSYQKLAEQFVKVARERGLSVSAASFHAWLMLQDAPLTADVVEVFCARLSQDTVAGTLPPADPETGKLLMELEAWRQQMQTPPAPEDANALVPQPPAS